MGALRICIPIEIVPYGIQLGGLVRHDARPLREDVSMRSESVNARTRLERDSEPLVNNEK
jgi:hypothetical protein